MLNTDRTVDLQTDMLRKWILTAFLSIQTLAKWITELIAVRLGNTQHLEYCLLTGQEARNLLPCNGAGTEVPSISLFVITPLVEPRLCLVSCLFCNYVSQNTTQVILQGAGLCMCGTCVRVCNVSQLIWAERIWHFHLSLSLNWGVGNSGRRAAELAGLGDQQNFNLDE